MRAVGERGRGRSEADAPRRHLDKRTARLGREGEGVLVPAADRAVARLAAAETEVAERFRGLCAVEAQQRQIASDGHDRSQFPGHVFILPPLISVVSCNPPRSEEHTSELQSLMRISYAVFC